MSRVGLMLRIDGGVDSKAQRRAEIAIRMALGGHMAPVSRMVVAQSLRLTLARVIVGVLGGFLSMRVLRSLFFGVSPIDPLLIAGAAVLLLVIAAVAGNAPARRAAHVEPAEAFRTE